MNKKILSLIIFTAFASLLLLTASKNSAPKKDFVKIDKKLYAAVHEVTNAEYRSFLKDLKTNGKADIYARCLYDSAQWVKKFPSSYMEPMKEKYHFHPAYDAYPVVNITKEAAERYCEWLTNRYQASGDKKYKKVKYRLPTEAEWKKLASPLPGHNLPWYGNFPYLPGEESKALANIKVRDEASGEDNYMFDGGLTTILIEHYKPNLLGIYDVIGNVSEIIQNGKQKGGSWDNYLDECTVDKTQNFTLPDPRVGFRVVMEVVEE